MKLLAFVGIIGVSVLQVLLAGFTFSVLWGWFIIPIFGLAALSISQAIGVSLTYSYVASSKPVEDNTKTAEERMIDQISWSITKAALALLIGCIAKGFI